MPRQLVFDLVPPPSYARDDFLVSDSNAEAHEIVTRWPDWPAPLLMLIGPAGSGKSHLAAIWARQAGAEIGRPDDLAGVSGQGAVLVEDADRAGFAEDTLFHLINRVRGAGGTLLLTARTPPDLWGVKTPDLLSRLRNAPTVPIAEPDAALLAALLIKLFTDRQIRIDEDVVAYAARHCDPNFDAVHRFVAAVDEESLAAGRRITRPLAARILAAAAEAGDED